VPSQATKPSETPAPSVTPRYDLRSLAAPAPCVASLFFDAMARIGKKAWLKHGALDYKECVGDDLAVKWGTPFARMLKLKRGETVVFSYVVYKSRAHRDRVNAKVMKDMEAMGVPKDMPFDVKRMVYGGFKVAVGS
jgi:uncharacterized protein YbaA (DUF1428 family)